MMHQDIIEAGFFGLFIFGLLSGSGHCLIMCGGIVSSLSASTGNRWLLLAAHQIGRVSSYVLAGIMIGVLGHLFQNIYWFRFSISIIAQLMIISMGIYLLGFTDLINKISKIGIPIWRLIAPVRNKLLPSDTLAKSLAAGFLWGWIPCGVSYAALMASAGASSVLGSASMMLAFGLGTVPALLLTGSFFSYFNRVSQNLIVRVLFGMFILSYGLYSLFKLLNKAGIIDILMHSSAVIHKM